MKKIFALSVLGLIASLASAPLAATASPTDNLEQMKALDYTIGTWNCHWTAGGQSGVIVSTFSKVLNGTWIEETEAVRSASGALVVTTMHFTGYDPVAKRWMHLGPDLGGGYEVATTPDFVTFHTILPAGQGDATFTKVSDAAFVLKEAFVQGDRQMTYVDDCKKAT